MKNILAIDYGKKRWGLAYCDELRIVFTLPANTQETHKERFEALKSIIEQRKISAIVLGLPLTLDGEETAMSGEVRKFQEELSVLKLPIFLVDEALSSYEASSILPKKSLKRGLPKRDGTLDSKAAALILEDFIAQGRAPTDA